MTQTNLVYRIIIQVGSLTFCTVHVLGENLYQIKTKVIKIINFN